MGIYDRDYSQDKYRQQQRPQMRFAMPKITSVVKKLLIANIAVFLVQAFGADVFLVKWFSVFPISFEVSLQFWRYITYQFLHGDIMHILFNMLGLFFLGPTLERHWGGRRFLMFYLGCGVAGGIFYPLLVGLGWLTVGPMIGASGAILGMLAACAILFPHFIVFIYFFPVPIRVAALILISISAVVIITGGKNAGGEAAHFAGMLAGAIYVLYQPWRARTKSKSNSNRWEKKMTDQRSLQMELDRILDKVHNSGIHSLTPREKKILRQATKAQQMRN